MESHSRGRLAAAFAVTVLALACALTGARAASTAVVQHGIFALLGSAPSIVSYARSTPNGDGAGTLTIRQFMGGGEKPIRHYEVDMQKLMHLIVVREDFATFEHLHPTFDATAGTFEQSFSRDRAHRYYAFADSTPRGSSQQVFRFTIDRDGTTQERQGAVPPFTATPSPSSVAAGPYTLTLSSTKLPARRGQAVTVAVLEGGKPAHDLTPYLGAAAHAVFIGTATLSYVHVHPTASSAPMAMGAAMNMSSHDAAGPHMLMELPPLPAGTYKLWIQFEGGGRLYTAPFTILSR